MNGARTPLPHPTAVAVLLFLAGTASVGAIEETGDRQYGIRWKVIADEHADYDSPCERIKDAAHLSPADFDRIFPWSHVRRCTVQRDATGTTIIRYESDPGFALDVSGGNVMVEIPKHFIRRRVADGYEYRLISAQPHPGFITDPAFVENGRELDKIYVGAYEAHVRADGRMESVSGVYPSADRTRLEFRSHAKANGPGFGVFDLRTLLLVQNLFLIEYADRNSQHAIGNGWAKILQPAKTHRCVLAERGVNRLITACPAPKTETALLQHLFSGCAIQITSYANPIQVLVKDRTLTGVTLDCPKPGLAAIRFDGSPIDTTLDMCLGGAAQKTGLSDRVASSSGRSAYHGGSPLDDYRCAVRYRYMENLWGNLWCILDGVNLANGRPYYCESMDGYASDSTAPPYRPTGCSLQIQDDNGDVGGDREIHYLRNLTWDPNIPWLALPQDSMNAGETSIPGASAALRNGNFGDYYYLNTKATCYAHGGGFDHYWRCGLFTLRGWLTERTKWYLYGSRLIFKPLDRVTVKPRPAGPG